MTRVGSIRCETFVSAARGKATPIQKFTLHGNEQIVSIETLPEEHGCILVRVWIVEQS